jgi:hypothetical protein
MAVAGVAVATDAPKFEEVDTNKDGRLTQEEAASVPELDFAAADMNQDGLLSRAEYAQAIG